MCGHDCLVDVSILHKKCVKKGRNSHHVFEWGRGKREREKGEKGTRQDTEGHCN